MTDAADARLPSQNDESRQSGADKQKSEETRSASSRYNAHTLTLGFHRFLSEQEWRTVVDAARQVPYVKHLEANAVLEPVPTVSEAPQVDEPVVSAPSGPETQENAAPSAPEKPTAEQARVRSPELREQIDEVGRHLMGYVMACQARKIKPDPAICHVIGLLSMMEIPAEWTTPSASEAARADLKAVPAGRSGPSVDPQKLIAGARAAERERCAKIAEHYNIYGHSVVEPQIKAIAAAIRQEPT